MIKNILKNFFKNLIYIFIPMGCFYLCLLLLLFALADAAISTVGKTAADFSLLLNQSIEDSETLLADFFSYAFSQINQSEDFTEILKEIFSTEWISKTVYGFLDTLNVSVDALKTGIEEIVAELRSTVATVLFASARPLSYPSGQQTSSLISFWREKRPEKPFRKRRSICSYNSH